MHRLSAKWMRISFAIKRRFAAENQLILERREPIGRGYKLSELRLPDVKESVAKVWHKKITIVMNNWNDSFLTKKYLNIVKSYKPIVHRSPLIYKMSFSFLIFFAWIYLKQHKLIARFNFQTCALVFPIENFNFNFTENKKYLIKLFSCFPGLE